MRHHRLLVVLAAVVLLALVSRIGQESVRLYCSVRPAAPEVAADAAAVARLRAQLRAAETRARSLEADLRGKCARREAAEPRVADRSSAPAPTETFVRTEANLPARAGQMVMMTYATGGVAEMLRNWVRARSSHMPSGHHARNGCVLRIAQVRHVQRLDTPPLVAAMDSAVVRQCESERFYCLDR